MDGSLDRDNHTDSLPKMIKTLPPDVFKKKPLRAYYFLIEGYFLSLLTAALIIYLNSWVAGIGLGVLLGFFLGGLFVVGHDCGHRSFSSSERVNNLIGHMTTSLVCWPFHLWRMDHDTHHRFTGHLDKDTAWRPITYGLWKRLPWFNRLVYLGTRIFFFMGSFYTTYSQIRDAIKLISANKYHDEQKKQVLTSLLVTAGCMLTYGFITFWAGGLLGFICAFLIPQIVFQCLLSTFTYFHHTHPDILFMNKKEWKPEVAQLTRTIHVRYPFWVEYFVRDINWHVPHHICVGIPHYHLRQAFESLKKRYPDHVNEVSFGFSLIHKVTTQCHFIRSKIFGYPTWVSYQDAVSLEREKKTTKAKARELST